MVVRIHPPEFDEVAGAATSSNLHTVRRLTGGESDQLAGAATSMTQARDLLGPGR